MMHANDVRFDSGRGIDRQERPSLESGSGLCNLKA
jgi:hypothetical protein